MQIKLEFDNRDTIEIDDYYDIQDTIEMDDDDYILGNNLDFESKYLWKGILIAFIHQNSVVDLQDNIEMDWCNNKHPLYYDL
jgi:hypothetical protein